MAAKLDTSVKFPWYVERLREREPFALYLFGDGEFRVAAGDVTGQRYTEYKENVDKLMVTLMLEAMYATDPSVVKGTDPHLIAPETYGGRDVVALNEAVDRFKHLWADRELTFVDGVEFDRHSRDGTLGPLLKALHGRDMVVVGHPFVCSLFAHARHVACPPTNAWASGPLLEAAVKSECWGLRDPVVVACCGLTAIPLLERLRQGNPDGTFMDLGSTFDSFVGLGQQRGWRRELYEEKGYGQLKAHVEANLAGVCGPGCGCYKVQSRLVPFFVDKGEVRWE